MISASELSHLAPDQVPASAIMLRRERFGIYRAQCCDPASMLANAFHQPFDIFGELKPGDNGTAADSVVAKCIQHAEICSGRKNPARCEVKQNQNSKDLFLVRIEWE